MFNPMRLALFLLFFSLSFVSLWGQSKAIDKMRKKELRSLCLKQQEELRQLRAEKEKLQAQLAEKRLLNSYLQMDLMDWSHCYEQLAQKPPIEIIMLDIKQLGLWSTSLPNQEEKRELLQWLISQRQEQLNLLRDRLADRQLPQSEKERLFGLFQQAYAPFANNWRRKDFGPNLQLWEQKSRNLLWQKTRADLSSSLAENQLIEASYRN
ncbi:hypothetical protein SGRA_4040 [Saprospira grandis str. Lewin]|uniref:Uncharacterized protein n=2 Tax=Saprospira TaxID=1007 RepID=H6L8N0_SAPGL|nr:hypothetical protein SGRA_4040 [Saprospira grandis str. Lewin]